MRDFYKVFVGCFTFLNSVYSTTGTDEFLNELHFLFPNSYTMKRVFFFSSLEVSTLCIFSLGSSVYEFRSCRLCVTAISFFLESCIYRSFFSVHEYVPACLIPWKMVDMMMVYVCGILWLTEPCFLLWNISPANYTLPFDFLSLHVEKTYFLLCMHSMNSPFVLLLFVSFTVQVQPLSP